MFEALANEHGHDINNVLWVKIGPFTCHTYPGCGLATLENFAQQWGKTQTTQKEK